MLRTGEGDTIAQGFGFVVEGSQRTQYPLIKEYKIVEAL